MSQLPNTPKHQFSNLVFEGGGVLGAAEVGAYNTLYNSGYLNNVQSVVGTSAGSILATLVSLSFTPDQLKSTILSCPFNTFKDLHPGVISYRFLTRFGIYRGDRLTKWLCDVVDSIYTHEPKYSLTPGRYTPFKDLTFSEFDDNPTNKNLSIISYNLDRGQSQTFDALSTLHVKVIDAIRASIAIPGFFSGMNMLVDGVSYFNVDGGVSANYPIRHFDLVSPNPYTLGIRVDSTSDRRRFLYTKPLKRYFNKFLSPIEVSSRLLSALYQKANGAHLDPADWNRTVFVDSLDISATNFDISPQAVKALYDSGVEGAEKYIKWLESISPLNPVQVAERA